MLIYLKFLHAEVYVKSATLISFLACSLIAVSTHAAPSQQLANYLGTGNNPRLHLDLSKNGPNWQSFSIDYQGVGGIPFSSVAAKDWSTWDVKDEKANYYGTITLHSDGSKATYGEYVPGKNGFYLEGIHFSFNKSIPGYQLIVDKIHGGGTDKGPFPDSPIAKPAVYPGTETKIELSVKGANIVNNKGQKIILKGFARPSLEWNPKGEYLSIDDIKKMHNWQGVPVNTIRLDLNQNFWFSSGPVTQKGSYKQILNAIVFHAIQNNMVVIFDLHWTENGHQSPMANKSSLRFWKEVANDYKDFGTVIFELFNEPYDVDKKTWLNGNNNFAGHQELLDAVRSMGANNICIVNGLDYAYDLSFVNDDFKLKGNNIVYGSHPYNEKGKEGHTGPGGSFAQNFKGVLGKYPLIFTEFGVNDASYFVQPNPGYEKVYARILDYADRNSISYTAFAWWVDADLAKSNVFPDVIQDWQGTPLNGGKLIHADMKKMPGTPIE